MIAPFRFGSIFVLVLVVVLGWGYDAEPKVWTGMPVCCPEGGSKTLSRRDYRTQPGVLTPGPD